MKPDSFSPSTDGSVTHGVDTCEQLPVPLLASEEIQSDTKTMKTEDDTELQYPNAQLLGPITDLMRSELFPGGEPIKVEAENLKSEVYAEVRYGDVEILRPVKADTESEPCLNDDQIKTEVELQSKTEEQSGAQLPSVSETQNELKTEITEWQQGDTDNQPRLMDLPVIKAEEGLKPLSCSKCGERFTRQRYLEYHELVVHLAVKPFRCGLCGKTFSNCSSLASHQRTHADRTQADPLYRCRDCGKTFMHATSLRCHQREHPNARPHSCTQCRKRFFEKRHLQKHLRTHSGEKPHACALCDKRFRWKGNLVHHQRLHTGQRFSCGHCEKTYTSTAKLKMHVQIVHTRSFCCPTCGRCFAEERILNSHLLLHSSKKPCCCNNCRGRCPPEDDVTTKARVAAGPFSCSECGERFAQKSSLECHQLGHAELWSLPSPSSERMKSEIEDMEYDEEQLVGSQAVELQTVEPIKEEYGLLSCPELDQVKTEIGQFQDIIVGHHFNSLNPCDDKEGLCSLPCLLPDQIKRETDTTDIKIELNEAPC